MSYLGLPPTSAAFITDTFSGTGSQTDFTMSVAPASTTSMLVVAGGVLQDPANYAIIGMTLRFSTAPPSGTGNISVRYMGVPAASVVNTAYRTVTDMTATAGQTTFTVPGYTVGFIDVFRNGARLGSADFTATSGVSIVFNVACNANDLVTTVSFSVQSVLNAIPNTPGAVTATNLAAGAARANFGAGAVLQVVSVVKSDIWGTSAASWTDIPGLAISITPTSATSKILVATQGMAGMGGSYSGAVKLQRNGTDICVGNSTAGYNQVSSANFYGGSADGNNNESWSIMYLDSPASTSAVTYKLQANSFQSGPLYINTLGSNITSQVYSMIGASTITLMEIAA